MILLLTIKFLCYFCIANLKTPQKMKKVLAFAFVATMVTFAACTSKPSEETAGDTTAVSMDTATVVDPMATDSMGMDTTMASDSVQ
jgi:hypothetical protein